MDAIAFDKDGTLVDLDKAWGPAAARWVEMAAADLPAAGDDLADRLGLDLVTGRLVPGGVFAVGTVDQLHTVTRETLAEHGMDPGEAARVADSARHASALAAEEGNLVPLGDVAGTLRALHDAGLLIAVVSSDDRLAVDAAVTALGIGHLVSTVVSGDEGIDPKPAPDALLTAARRLGVAPARMLYVGDSWVDAEAGRAAGTAGVVLVGEPTPDAVAIASASVPSVDSLTAGS